MTTETISSRDARSKWRDVLDKVFSRTADVVIERNGQPVAVLIPVEDYEALQGELDDLRAARQAGVLYEEWRRDPSTARPLEDIEADLRAKGLLDE
ncbi:MAG TPA: type II toxin-antitoxin system Phd/YefM family antitoxin [Aggregatilinea sp.]|uniref:type II toxin-antitoxin system Phd/YefM family antitoxin n=1 Tax=Aggregatilinea sp. TaxID=2806333 RepID=UPI002C86257C|nr:type II toxin-antitoxin system Phd/YefM family antitoxin [Aggregatilinea sp.]HML21313.1 type II toxin-antitoxin system Phd/YefM family antitoxin [Aggregatilinea sp.]